MLPFRPFQNECAGVSKRDEFLAALDFDDLGERYRPAIAIPFRHVSQYAVARAAGLLTKWSFTAVHESIDGANAKCRPGYRCFRMSTGCPLEGFLLEFRPQGILEC
jgi:hypothetical protein